MNEKAFEQYKNQAREIWAMRLPFLPVGVKISVGDVDKYTQMKNEIMDKMLSIEAPLLSEADKLGVWAWYSDEFDQMIRNSME